MVFRRKCFSGTFKSARNQLKTQSVEAVEQLKIGFAENPCLNLKVFHSCASRQYSEAHEKALTSLLAKAGSRIWDPGIPKQKPFVCSMNRDLKCEQ